MHLSEKIQLLRKQQGLSQEALADQLGVSRQAVSRWETGSALPDAGNLLQLSRLFGVTADSLLSDDCDPTPPVSAQPGGWSGEKNGAWPACAWPEPVCWAISSSIFSPAPLP